MYTKEINPRISERDFRFIKAVYKSYGKMTYCEVTIDFIFTLRRIFKMRHVAQWLGVSVRHVYRLLKAEHDQSKANRLFYLINNITSQDDYKTFVEVCANDGIEVKS